MLNTCAPGVSNRRPHPIAVPPAVTAAMRAAGVFHHAPPSRYARHEMGKSRPAKIPTTATITEPITQCISTAPASRRIPATTPGSSSETRSATAASATSNPSASALSRWARPVMAIGTDTATPSA